MLFKILLCAFFSFSLIHSVLQQICVYHIFNASSHEPKQCIKEQRYHLTTKVHIVKAMIFPVVLYGCEGWTVKKAECRRIDAFKLWCWRRLLRVS